MEKRSFSKRLREPKLDEVDNSGEGQNTPTVRLVSLISGILKYPGPITGREYVFSQGIPQDVDKEDADAMVLIARKGCCGSPSRAIFQTV